MNAKNCQCFLPPPHRQCGYFDYLCRKYYVMSTKTHLNIIFLAIIWFVCLDVFAQDAQGLTTRQLSARQDAVTLLGYDKPYSRYGLITELEFQGYLFTDAEAAVDDIGINWNEQAKNMAKKYLRLDAFSKEGLTKQLEEEGFSHEEAVAGVKSCSANWKDQAKRMASDFSHTYATSREEIIQQLEDKGFTHDQAVYGANKNGFSDENNFFNKIKKKFNKDKDED